MQKIKFTSVVLTLYILWLAHPGIAEQCDIRNGSLKIYISDSHVGMGGQCSSESENCRDGWHNMEDFRWHKDFAQFLDYFEEANKPVDFVIIGDFLELWQDMANIPCQDDAQGSDLGCNAVQAIKRVQKVGEKHQELFKALSDFITSEKGNKIIILPGNHDAAFAMDTVADTMKKLFIGETGKNVCIDEDGMIYANGIFVEHGHQIEGDLNRYSKPLNGTIECINQDGKAVNCNDNNAFVRRSWGENFVQNYYNDYENRFPVIDNYSAEGSGLPDGVKRGLRASSLPQKTSAGLGFVSFLFTKNTWDHYIRGLGDKRSVTRICKNDDQQPCLDIDSMKQLTASDKIFADLPQGGNELVGLIFPSEQGDKEITLGDVYSSVDKDALPILDEILITTCIYWDKTEDNDEGITCAYKNKPLGEVGNGIKHWFKGILDRDYEKITDHIEQREEKINKKIQHFIYGHTHRAEQRDTADGSKKILNTGAWQRVVTAKGMKNIIKAKSLSFKDMTPNLLPACYSFAVSDSGGDPTLLWWASKEPTEPGKALEFDIYTHGGTPEHCLHDKRTSL